MISFYCQGCGHHYQVPDEWAGKKVRCKKCSHLSPIPSLGHNEQSEISRANTTIQSNNIQIPEDTGEDEKIIYFSCLMCKTELKAPESMRGKTVLCHHCQCYAEVPGHPVHTPIQEDSTTFQLKKETKDCPYCGEEILKNAKKCKHCGEFLDDSVAESYHSGYGLNIPSSISYRKNRKPEIEPSCNELDYAGFWRRVLASLIDVIPYFILGGIAYFIGTFVASLLVVMSEGSPEDWSEELTMETGIMGVFFAYILIQIFQWIYKAGMESSERQGTFGKMAVGLQVVKLNGEKISFGRATGRYLLYIIISSIPLLGFISFCMAGWTEKKQTLYDLACGVTVIKV